jgi:hypothetical protein
MCIYFPYLTLNVTAVTPVIDILRFYKHCIIVSLQSFVFTCACVHACTHTHTRVCLCAMGITITTTVQWHFDQCGLWGGKVYLLFTQNPHTGIILPFICHWVPVTFFGLFGGNLFISFCFCLRGWFCCAWVTSYTHASALWPALYICH